MALLQDVVVTAVALIALWILARRVFGFVKPASPAGPTCANCPSNASTSRTPQPLGAEEHPLVFLKSSRR